MHESTENPHNGTDTALYHEITYADCENTRSNDGSTDADIIDYSSYTIRDVCKHSSIKSHFSVHLLL
ncbi:hypothetical protein [Methanosarcina siciliae]|uniref:hypothetical protein n=1 Tax=Methanosarcina siciliae TaxID=38027 RepID=UPI0012E0236A|nr:hypothetical protein [Methanosarcina siciliae]